MAWRSPDYRALLIWRGARAIGLSPWDPTVLNLTEFQLQFAAVQGEEDKGLPVRKAREDAVSERIRDKGAELAIWWADHVTRNLG